LLLVDIVILTDHYFVSLFVLSCLSSVHDTINPRWIQLFSGVGAIILHFTVYSKTACS